MKVSLKFKNLFIHSILVISLITLSACTSPEDKANAFYENGMQLLEKGELIKANVEFRNALQLNKKLTKAIWGQVLVSEKQGKSLQQYKLLNEMLIAEPEHIQALVKIGRLLLLAGQLDKALEKSDLLMKINNQDSSVLSLRAAIMLRLDNSSAAVKLAKQVLVNEHLYIDAILILASERLVAGDAQKAIDYIEQGLKSGNENIALQLIKIKALESLKKFNLIEGVYKDLIESHPKNNSFNMMLAQLYLRRGEKEKAEKVYIKIVEDNPNDLKAKIRLVKFISGSKGLDAGLKQLLKFSEQNPENYELKFSLVQFYMVSKEVDLANKLLEKIISEKSGTEIAIKAKGIMAALLLAKGEKKSAEVIVEDILSIDKQNKNGLILKASIDIDRQKYDEAIGALRLVLRDTPNSSRAQFFLARAYSLSGSPELADEQYFKAFKTSKFNSAYGLNYAQFLLKRKQVKRAEKVLQDTLSVSGRNFPALRQLAQIKLLLGDWVGAQQVADEIKRIGDKGNLANTISNAIMVGKKDYSESIELLKKTYRSTPENNQPIAALVRTYLLAGKNQEAGSFLDSVINVSPKNSAARILRGQVYVSQGKVEQAIKVYEEAIEIDSINTAAYYHLAVIYIREKKYDKANKILNKGLLVEPKSFSLGITLASLYERTNQIDKAIAVYAGLLKEKPDADIVANNLASLLTENKNDKKSFNKAYVLSQRFKRSDVPQFKDTFGWASYRVGKYSDASSLIKSAIKQSPNIPDFHYHLGMTYIAKENKKMAREELEKALKLAGDKPFAKSKEIRATLEKL